MTELAAAAYDAEQEHVDTALEVRDEMGVRDLMLRLAKVEQECTAVAELRDRVVERYDQRLAGLKDEADAIRSSIEAFILHVNEGRKVSIPDAGTAYLTTRNKGGKVKLADASELENWLAMEGRDDLMAFTEPSLNGKVTLELAHDALFYATPDGKLVHRDTGEVIEVPGVEVEPESKSLALRKAS